DARINYLPYDGRHFPVRDQSFDAVLLCYVLHHAHDPQLVLNEVSRVLREGGLAIIYEDMPTLWWDRVVCWTHDRQWRGRTGPCTFHAEHDWRRIFNLSGFEVVKERPLSRWRNLAHPVSRRFFVIKSQEQPHRIHKRFQDYANPVEIMESCQIYSGSGNTSARSPY